MPQHQQSIILNNTDAETALAYAYDTMRQLSWNILFAGENTLVGSTPKSWKNKGQQVICTLTGNILEIKSEMINNELADVMGINKKNTTAFIKAYETVSKNNNQSTIDSDKNALAELRNATIKKVAEEREQAIALDKAMNLSGSNLYVTYAIMAINILVFCIMAVNGAGVLEANAYVHIQYGSNFSPLTLSGDWWRLITNTFIHFGIIHLAMNMYCLYTVGIYLEPMLGKARYTTAYFCTGILASITSLWWHTETVNSAGASGAVFGLYGLFFALLISNLIPKTVRLSLLKSIGIFIVFNLAYGMKSGVDNAAHVGGLISGFVIGLGYLLALTKEKNEQKLQWLLPLVMIISIGIGYGYLGQHKMPVAERAGIIKAINAGKFEDNEKFISKLMKFDEIHALVDSTVYDTTLSNNDLVKNINEIALPKWSEATLLMNNTKKMNISPASHSKATMVLDYITLRTTEMNLMKEMIEKDKVDDMMAQLKMNRKNAAALFEDLLKL
ncbi:MAG: rhomboid family intramembrane serine protease [Ferruginibacter sp.]